MEISNGHLSIAGKPFFLYSGEIHYFRIPKPQWANRLKSLKSAGFNTVSTYIPWIWHEPVEGKMDFNGKTSPERDVLGFFDLAHRLGLHVSARVGPISNAELVHEGLPAWLLKDNPEIFVTGRRDVGNLPHVTIVSYLHPVFQKKVAAWYEALLPNLAPRQKNRGGNIISVQLCNEVAMVHWLQKGADYKDHVNTMFRHFLKEKYKTLSALNDAHQSQHTSFASVPQPLGEAVDPARYAIHVDWALFYRHYYATYFQTLSHRAWSQGIEVPLFCNIPQFYDYDIRGRGNWAPMTTSMFRDFPLLTPNLIFGGAYQMRHLDFENFHDVSITTEVTRMLGAVRVIEESAGALPEPNHLPPLPRFESLPDSPVPVVCAELQTGIMRDRPRLYPQQVALNVKSSVGQGLAGLNAYMFAGGRNPRGLGAFGTYHDWQAPVGPGGEPRAHLAPLKDFGRFLKWAGPHLALTKKNVDTTLGFYFPYYATEYCSAPWTDQIEAQRTNLWYDGMARLIHLAGYSVNSTDIQRSPEEVLSKHKSLWVYSLGFMDHDTQLKLAAYVKNGGALFLGPSLPTHDLRGQKDRTLANELGIKITGGQTGNLFPGKKQDEWVQGPIQTYSATKETRRWMELASGPAVIQAESGKGKVLVVGFGMPHVFDHFRHWVREWAENMGVFPKVNCDPWDLQASLRTSKESGFLFLFNYHFTSRTGSVTLPLPGTGKNLRLPKKGTIVLPPLSGVILPLNIPLSPGVSLTHSTAEVLEVSVTPRGLRAVLSAPLPQRVEMIVSLPKKPRSISGKGGTPSLTWTPGCATLSIPTTAPETSIYLTF
ncbi:MAG: beta-galactosidase [Elusimicrobia bacterium]|nr:beta-galactosidase [Elusimicrobiota bacterium]